MTKTLNVFALYLLLICTACADPENSAYPGYYFNANGEECFIGLFSIDNAEYPEIVYPALLIKENGFWNEVAIRQPLWIDSQEDINPTIMTGLIIRDFNTVLEERNGALSWNEKLAAMIENLTSVNNQLLVK